METEMSWETASYIVRKKGITEWLMMLMKAYPKLGIYSVSMDWLRGPQFACKAKGSQGDLIIRWKDDSWAEDDSILKACG